MTDLGRKMKNKMTKKNALSKFRKQFKPKNKFYSSIKDQKISGWEDFAQHLLNCDRITVDQHNNWINPFY